MSQPARHVHLIGVGGVGMASLSGLFKEKGLRVTGSDTGVYPPMSDMLRDSGVEIREGYRPENLKDKPDMVIVGNAISRDNPEAAELLRLGFPYMSMPQALWEFFLKDKERIVVAGTHGKTTTSSLIAWILYSAGLDPSFLIGGLPRNFGRGFRLGNGRHFVVEGDEYDTAFFDKGPKFLHYRGQKCVLTAVEFDHADIYKDLKHVKESFRKYVCGIPKDGFLAVSADYPHAMDVSKEQRKQET
jgi:UDP-N-acetylmuramate: L-alanyl-gamma-D-glutamyl-meso-diaminopimelate ligase